ncbi:MAG: hypothetical protein E6Z06_02895 [Clostridiales bacterium]|nr:hypothetical protein [Clostridiales bacterium]
MEEYNIDSVLDSIKKVLGDNPGFEYFNPDIIMQINTFFTVLTQIGVGPKEGVFITDNTTTWSDLFGTDARLNSIKTYIFSRVKLLFNPSQNSSYNEILKDTIKELEWRLNVQCDDWGNTEEVRHE